MPSNEDFAYAAGVIDSDGWFTCGFSRGVRSSGTPWAHWYFRCGVKQVEPQCISFLHETFGGSVHFRYDPTNKLGKRPLYTWSLVGSRKLIPFIEGILPYMKIKHDRAALIFEFYDHYRNISHLTGNERNAEHARRSDIRDRLKQMNHAEVLPVGIPVFREQVIAMRLTSKASGLPMQRSLKFT